MAENNKKFHQTTKGKWSMSILALIVTIGGVLMVGRTWIVEPIIKDVYEKEIKKQIDIRIDERIQLNPTIQSLGNIQSTLNRIEGKQEKFYTEFIEFKIIAAGKGIQ